MKVITEEYNKLKAENNELKKENKSAKDENINYQSEVAKLNKTIEKLRLFEVENREYLKTLTENRNTLQQYKTEIDNLKLMKDKEVSDVEMKYTVNITFFNPNRKLYIKLI